MNPVPGAGGGLALPVQEHELGQTRLGILHSDEGVHDLIGVKVFFHLIDAVLALQIKSMIDFGMGSDDEYHLTFETSFRSKVFPS